MNGRMTDTHDLFYRNGYNAAKKELANEIERLQELVDNAQRRVMLWKEKVDNQQQRIEELEQTLDQLLEDSLDPEYLAAVRGHHISTDEQIAAAVEVAVRSPYEAAVKRTWNALNKLNIFRCSHPRGEWSEHGSFSSCPDCNGKGWVKK